MKGVDYIMSDEERAIQKAELRSILMSVPLKAIISGLITYAITSSQDTSVGMKIFFFVFLYSMLSVYIFISKRVGNWIVGGVVMLGLIFAAALLNLPDAVLTIFGLVFIFGGFTLDAMRILKYIRLSVKLKPAGALPNEANNE